jgi:cytidine deaminase
MNETKLIEKAIEAMHKAYAPYSNFKVGAALLTKSGRIFTGCNVENASFGLSICAERVAIFSAVSAGELQFEKLVVVANTDSPVSPCGACRQVMSEFGDFEVLLVNTRGELVRTRVSELLPRAFKLKEG